MVRLFCGLPLDDELLEELEELEELLDDEELLLEEELDDDELELLDELLELEELLEDELLLEDEEAVTPSLPPAPQAPKPVARMPINNARVVLHMMSAL